MLQFFKNRRVLFACCLWFVGIVAMCAYKSSNWKRVLLVCLLLFPLLLGVAYVTNMDIEVYRNHSGGVAFAVKYGSPPAPAAVRDFVVDSHLEAQTPKPADDNDPTCQVCLTNIVDTAVVPCGHLFCSECLRDQHRQTDNKKCPSCRGEIQFGRPIVLTTGNKSAPVS